MKETAGTAVLKQLAREGRRVLSDWRALILWRRATASTSSLDRRWTHMPSDLEEVHSLLRRMVDRREITRLPNLGHLYEVTVPYAPTGHVEEDEILMELNPYGALSHLTAMVFHGLTDELPKHTILSIPGKGTNGLVPLGTDPLDWQGLSPPSGSTPNVLRRLPLTWVRLKPTRYFGTQEYRPHEYPVRVMTPERTLLDGLQNPELSGGVENVLTAWASASDTLNVETLVYYVQLYGVRLLRQRVGYVLEEMGMSHPVLEEWSRTSKRGGSSKLIASLPYVPTYSERWNLSINTSTSILREISI